MALYRIIDENGNIICDNIDEARLYRQQQKEHDGRFRVALIYGMKDLFDEISEDAYLEADAAIDSGIDKKVAAHYIDIQEEKNQIKVHNSLRIAIAECERVLFTLLKYRLRDHVSLDNYNFGDHKTEYVVEFYAATTTQHQTICLIRDIIREYIVARALRDFTLLTYPAAAEKWGQMMDQSKAQLEDAARLCLNLKPVRKPFPIW